MDSAVKIENVSVELGRGFLALSDITLDLAAGKITGFIGPSGAGKTTLIRVIVGRQKITKGQITVLGLPAGSAKLRPLISYMTQEISVYDDLTVQENLRYFTSMAGLNRSKSRATITEILTKVDLIGHKDSLIRNLSGGQKQRVSLAVALIGQPKLMVLDEPTVGLDPVLREQLWQLFRELAANGTTIIISSHVMDEAERCDDLLLLRSGRLLAHDSPSGLRRKTSSATVEQSFLSLVGAAK